MSGFNMEVTKTPGIKLGGASSSGMKMTGSMDAYTMEQADERFATKLELAKLADATSPEKIEKILTECAGENKVVSFTDTTKSGWVKFADVIFTETRQETAATLHIKQVNFEANPSVDIIAYIYANSATSYDSPTVRFMQMLGKDVTSFLKYVIDDNGKVSFYINKGSVTRNWYINAYMITNSEYITFYSEDYTDLVTELDEGENAEYLVHPFAYADRKGNTIDTYYATKAEVKLKQNALSEEQLANINAVPGKADKTEVANAVKEIATGSFIVLKDVSPLLNEVSVKIKEKFPGTDPYISGIKVYKIGKNIWNQEVEYDSYYECNVSDYIQVVNGRQYCLYIAGKTASGYTSLFHSVIYYDSNKQQIHKDTIDEEIGGINTYCMITIPDECCYIKVLFSAYFPELYRSVTYICEIEAIYSGDDDGNVTIPTPIEDDTILMLDDAIYFLECEYSRDTNAVISDINSNIGELVEKWELVAQYIHSGNRKLQPTALDLETGYFTCENHGLSEDQTIMVLQNPEYQTGVSEYIPFELFVKANYNTQRMYLREKTVAVIDENTFALKQADSIITYPSTKNRGVDATRFYFETIDGGEFSGFNNLGIDMREYDVKIVADNPNIRVSFKINNNSLIKYQTTNSYGHSGGIGNSFHTTPCCGVCSRGRTILEFDGRNLVADLRNSTRWVADATPLASGLIDDSAYYNVLVPSSNEVFCANPIINSLSVDFYYSDKHMRNGGCIEVWKKRK